MCCSFVSAFCFFLFVFSPEMAEIIAIVLDNGIESQNQDYLPSRFFIQRDATVNIINQVFDDHTQSLLGIFPLCQEIKNKIITPTGEKQHLIDFVFACDLNKNMDHTLALFQADQAMQLSSLSTKKLLIFLSSPIVEFGRLLSEICTIALKGVEIKLVCFGDALNFGMVSQSEIQLPNVQVLTLENTANAEDALYDFLTEGEYEDPELKEALQKSMYEK